MEWTGSGFGSEGEVTPIEQAKRSRDPLAAIELLDAMEGWSDESFAAGWIIGLAKYVDAAVAGKITIGDGWHQIDEGTLATFRRCREACGGTWVHDAGIPGWRRFVTEEEWIASGRKEEHDS